MNRNPILRYAHPLRKLANIRLAIDELFKMYSPLAIRPLHTVRIASFFRDAITVIDTVSVANSTIGSPQSRQLSSISCNSIAPSRQQLLGLETQANTNLPVAANIAAWLFSQGWRLSHPRRLDSEMRLSTFTVLDQASIGRPSAQGASAVTNKPKDSDSPILSGAARFREAFERLREDIAAVGEGDLVAMTVDVPTVVVAVLGRIPQLLEFRRALLRALPELDIGHLDRLQTCARALGHAHTLYIGASEEANALADMASELSRCRKMFVNDVTALAQREMVDGAKLKELLGPVGYKNLARCTPVGSFDARPVAEHPGPTQASAIVRLDLLWGSCLLGSVYVGTWCGARSVRVTG